MAEPQRSARGGNHGLLYGLGVFLASFSGGKLWLLYLTYGVIADRVGLELHRPVAVLVKWFPERRA